MPFTQEQDAFILMAHFRSGTENADGSWTYSLQSCIQQFNQAFPDADVNYNAFVNRKHYIIQRFNTKYCICKGKSPGRPTVLNQETVDDIQARIERSPQKSIKKLSTQTGLSYGTCRKALKKNLHLHPYKVSVVQEIFPHDFQARIQFCHWFNENLNNDNILNLTFMSDEAWFYLSEFINSQNYRTWAAENPHTIVDTSLHPECEYFFDIIVIMESWLNDSVKNGELFPAEYDVVRCDRSFNVLNKSRGGGVIVGISRSLTFEAIDASDFFRSIPLVDYIICKCQFF